MLSQRAKLIYLAIALCTTTALLVCAVVAFLFVSAFLQFDASVIAALLVIAAMSTFVLGLLWFLREIIQVSSASVSAHDKEATTQPLNNVLELRECQPAVMESGMSVEISANTRLGGVT